LPWCIYTTTLEPILARISEMDERSAPPPAAEDGDLPRRTFCFTIFDLRAPLKILIKEKQSVLLGSALTRGRRSYIYGSRAKSFLPLQLPSTFCLFVGTLVTLPKTIFLVMAL